MISRMIFSQTEGPKGITQSIYQVPIDTPQRIDVPRDVPVLSLSVNNLVKKVLVVQNHQLCKYF